MQHIKNLSLFFILSLVTENAFTQASEIKNVELQDLLDSGKDLLLEPGITYLMNEPLKFKAEGQKISTIKL